MSNEIRTFEDVKKYIRNTLGKDATHVIDEIANLESNIKAEKFFQKHNSYDKKYIQNLYSKLVGYLPVSYSSRNSKKNDGWGNINVDNIKRTHIAKKCKGIIDKECQKSIEKLNKENQIIYEYRCYRELFRNVTLIKKYFIENEQESDLDKKDSVLNTLNQVNFDFLNSYNKFSEKYFSEQYKGDSLSEDFFKKKFIELKNDAIKAFKDVNLNLFDFLPSKGFIQKLSSKIGKKNYDDVRNNVNSTEKEENKKYEEHYMNLIEENKKLSEITQIGSHDAGTYSIRKESSKDIVGAMAQTQTGSFLSQLRNGVTVFDCRLRLVKNTVCFFHGIANGGNFLHALTQIEKYIGQNNKVIVTLHIFSDNKTINFLMKIPYVKNFFEKYVLKHENRKLANLTLGEIRQKKKNVLIATSFNKYTALEKYAFHENLLHRFDKRARQSNKDSTLIKGEVAYTMAANSQNKDKSKLTTVSPFHTPGTKSFLSALFGTKKSYNNFPIKSSEKKYSKLVSKYGKQLNSNNNKQNEEPNIWFCDNASNEEVAEENKKILEKNKEILKKNPTRR